MRRKHVNRSMKCKRQPQRFAQVQRFLCERYLRMIGGNRSDVPMPARQPSQAERSSRLSGTSPAGKLGSCFHGVQSPTSLFSAMRSTCDHPRLSNKQSIDCNQAHGVSHPLIFPHLRYLFSTIRSTSAISRRSTPGCSAAGQTKARRSWLDGRMSRHGQLQQ